LAIANQKGGVGKTTTSINLASALAALERRVLLVDCDPQGNATRGLGLEAGSPTLYDVLGEAAPAAAAIRPTALPHLDLLPADRELVGVEVEFVGLDGWQRRLDRSLESVSGSYDFVLLDTPPSLGHLTLLALTAADGVLVPMQCEYFALESEVRRHFEAETFDTVVPRNVRLAEAPSHGLSILQYDIKSRGAEAYLALARELLERER
jgi:chromosome partitioning protein